MKDEKKWKGEKNVRYEMLKNVSKTVAKLCILR